MKHRSQFLRRLEDITREKNLAQPSETEMGRILARLAQARLQERRLRTAGVVEMLKAAHPEHYERLAEKVREIGLKASSGRKMLDCTVKLLGEDAGLGAAAANGEFLVPMLFDAVALGGAWSSMATPTPDAVTGKFPVATVRPAARFIVTEGDTLTDDVSAAGTSVLTNTQLAGVLATISLEWFMDTKRPLIEEWLTLAIEAINLLVDGAVFQGDGTANATFGSVTGIYNVSGIPTVTGAAGNTTVQALGRSDIVNLVSAVEGSAQQHDPRFFAHPDFLGPLMQITDGAGRPILQTGLETGADEDFLLVGQPLTLTGGGPNTNSAGQKVLCYGRPTAYAVGVARDFEIMASSQKAFSSGGVVYRVLLRVGGAIKRKESLAILKTAAV